jgi:hypothetical protein
LTRQYWTKRAPASLIAAAPSLPVHAYAADAEPVLPSTTNTWNGFYAEQVHAFALFLAIPAYGRMKPRTFSAVTWRWQRMTPPALILEIEVRGKRGVGFCKSTRAR